MIERIAARSGSEDDEFLSRYPLIKPAKEHIAISKSSIGDGSRKHADYKMFNERYGRFHPYAAPQPKLNPAPQLRPLHQQGQYCTVVPSMSDELDARPGKGEQTFPSYTAMIAQAILSADQRKTTLGGIYEYIESRFRGLEKRVKGWRNCVRHNLSLNECFIKLGRSDCGRGNDWAIHPNYLQSFLRGEYRKRRACMKPRQDFSWMAREYSSYAKALPTSDRPWNPRYHMVSYMAASARSSEPPSPTSSNSSYGESMVPSPSACSCVIPC